MSKIMIYMAAMAFIAFGYMSSSAVGYMPPSDVEELIEQRMATAAEDVSKWIGKDVKNKEGEDLGTVRDIVKDSMGRKSFAVLSHGGFLGIGSKKVAVPYSALSYDKERGYFVLDVTKERLAGAPEFENREKLVDRSVAEDIYRYFGQRPSWMEEPMMKEGPEKSKEILGY